MGKLLSVVCIIILLGCGSHKSESFGFTQNGDVSNGLKADTLEGKLKTAMDTADFAAFTALLAEGASVDTLVPGANGATLLIYSAIKNLPKFTHVLLEAGADKALVDKNGKTAFQNAEEIGNRGRILMLLDPARQAQAQADLLVAIQKKKVPTIEDLLKAGTDPNFIEEATGETPLTKAILLKKGTHVVKFIAEWQDKEIGVTGTDINFTNASGQTPLAFAIAQDNQEVIVILKSLNAKETL